MTDRLILFDTTLRDGEQAPGFSMNLPEKLRLAQALDRLGVDVLEAGFPAASDGDFEAVQAIANTVKKTSVCGLSRCHEGDIERAWQALRDAAQPRLHVFLATSPIHREHKLKMDRNAVLERIAKGVEHARSLCDDVEFSAEDAVRTERDFLIEAAQVAIDHGATTINLPDTVGYALPQELATLFSQVREGVRNSDSVIWSCHCHDDLGLAVANSLAAIGAGARQVECTINGIGERAGNCSLEEIAMIVQTRAEEFGLQSSIDSTRLVPTSTLLSTITGVPVQPNKAIVGANAFAHEAGIHQHGVLAHRETYEIMHPADVGLNSNRLVLGKHSGRHAVRDRLTELGLEVGAEQFEDLFEAFKNLADRKKTVEDADLEALVVGHEHAQGPWHLISLQTTSGTEALPTATIQVRHEDGTERAEAAVGDGPIDATFQALSKATGRGNPGLLDYQVRSITWGNDAQGQVTVHCDQEGRQVRGQGLSTDIVEASAKAFLEVINQCARRLESVR